MALMPDVSALLFDPDLGAQEFTIKRRTGKWIGGRMTVDSETIIRAIGVIQPPSAEQLVFFPEGERRKGQIVIYTTTMLHLTDGSDIADDVTWNGEQYKLVNVKRWNDYGYVEAYAELR